MKDKLEIGLEGSPERIWPTDPDPARMRARRLRECAPSARLETRRCQARKSMPSAGGSPRGTY